MSTTIYKKYIGVGNRYIIPLDCLFTSFCADAQDYWDRLTASNGGVEVSGVLYSITDCALKIAINNWFIGVQSLQKRNAYLYIGGTAATHAVSAYTAAPSEDLSFVSVTHNNLGITFNGTTSYANTSILAGSETVDTGLAARYAQSTGVGTIQTFMGTALSTGSVFLLSRSQLTPATRLSGTMFSESVICTRPTLTAFAASSGFACISSLAGVLNLYQNGVVVNTSTGVACGVKPISNIYIGAENLLGTASVFFKGTMSFNAVGFTDGITLTTITNNLNNSLNR